MSAPQPAPTSFRRLLRAYPPSWQATNAEALLGVMLDVADAEGRSRPTAREGMAVVRHAARTWVDTGGEQLRRSGVGDSFDWIAPAALTLGTTLSILSFVFGEWFPGVQLQWGDDFHAGRFGPFPSAGPLLYAVWLLAFGAVMAGATSSARMLLALAAVGGPVLQMVCDQLGTARPPLMLINALTIFAVTAFVGLPHIDTARRRLAITTVGTTGGTALLLAGVTATGLALPQSGLIGGFSARLDISDPGLLDLYLGWGFYRVNGLGTLVWLAAPVILGWLLVSLATAWWRPSQAMAAGLLGVPALLIDPRTATSIWIDDLTHSYGVPLVAMLGALSVGVSLLVVGVRAARAGAAPSPGATA